MGNLFRPRTTTTQQPFENNPWEPQQPFLIEGMQTSLDALNAATQGLSGITDYAADLTPGQTAAAQLMQSLGLGGYQTMGGSFQGAGQMGMDAFGQSVGNASDLYSMGTTDPTQAILDNAGAYASNPQLDNVIQSAIRDVNEGFQRQVGDINAGAVGSGNINSTRAGALEAMALDDAMDRAGDISSTLRGNAWESGLDRAMVTNQNMFDNGMSANANLSAAGLAGTQLGITGLNLGAQGAGLAGTGGEIFQNQSQAEIDGTRLQLQEPLNLAALYMGAVGNPMGSQGFTSQTQVRQSPFQTLLGVGSTLGGLGWSPFCWTARAVYGVHDPRWKQFRDWMLYRAPEWVLNIYLKNGERWADWINRHPWSKPLIKPIMEILRRL